MAEKKGNEDAFFIGYTLLSLLYYEKFEIELLSASICDEFHWQVMEMFNSSDGWLLEFPSAFW